MAYEPQFRSSSKMPPSLRFTQVVKIGDEESYTLFGLTREGVLYRRAYDRDAEQFVWQPAPAFSSTALVDDLTCSAGCGACFKGFLHERCPACGKGELQLPQV